MPSTSRTFDIEQIVDEKYSQQNNSIDFAKQQIVILDEAKEPYKAALSGIDALLYQDIEDVNDTLVAVTSAYQARIDAGCRTDLFWAQTGFSTGPNTWTYTCTRVSYVGYGSTSTLPPGVGLGSTGTPIPDKHGYETDNLHGIKQYGEPYSEDLLDTFIGAGIGTIGVGTTELFILAPLNSTAITGLQAGQIVQSSKPVVFAGNVNTIVGVGTTIKDLSGIPSLGITTNKSTINVLTLEDQAIGNAKAPEDDNSLVTFTVLISPDDLPEDFAIPFGSGAYTPQTVSMMSGNSVGSATSIRYDNSGNPSASQQWNQFLNGFPDPDGEEGDKISPPNVGAGITHYLVGFTDQPTYLGNPATAGQVVTSTIQFGYPFSPVAVAALPTCPTEEAALTAAIAARDAKEAEFNSGIGTFNDRLYLTNTLRDDLNELNLRIWAYRMQIGRAKANQGKYDTLKGLINENQDLIDNV
jgi:hypothetical protein